MLEIYDLYWENKKIGYITHDLDNNQLSADLTDDTDKFPRRLFGIAEVKKHVGDKEVRWYLDNTVAPKNRENIDDILKALGLKEYDSWGIYKGYHGRNANDYCHIVFREKIQ